MDPNTEPLQERQFTPEQRKAMADSGMAMPDGSYPIETKADLANAIQAYGRSPDAATKQHIMKRARAMGMMDMMPEDWKAAMMKESVGDTQQEAQATLAEATAPISLTSHVIEAVAGSQGREWDVILIESGLSKNGNYYPPETLKAAVPLFEGCAAFADHATDAERVARPERSVKDKVGKFSQVVFGNFQIGGALVEGIKARFKVLAPWLREVLVEAVQAGEPDFLGFSIDAEGKVSRKQYGGRLVNWVEQIVRVHSTDVVTDPAAGGRVVRLVASNDGRSETAKEIDMDPEELKRLIAEATAAALAPMQTELAALKETAKAPPIIDVEAREALAALKEAARLTGNKQRIDAAIAATKLSESGRKRVAKGWYATAERRDVTDDELTADIQEAVSYEAAVTAPKPFGTPRTVEVGAGSHDKMLKGLQGMFDNKDIDGTPRFRSVREAYCRWHGLNFFDVPATEYLDAFRGHYTSSNDSKRVQESLTTATWADVFADTLYRKMIASYSAAEWQSWRQFVSDIETFTDFRTRHFVRVGGYADLSSVSEQGTYPTLTSPGDEEVEAAPTKYGGIDDLTWEAIMNDQMGQVRRIPQKMGEAAARTLFRDVMDLITTDDPTLDFDSTTLYDSSGHANEGSTALSVDGVNAAVIAMRSQTEYGNTSSILGPRNYPRFCIVPNELEQRARRIFEPSAAYSAMILDSDAGPSGAGTGLDPMAFANKGTTVVVYDYLTDATDWYLVADPNKVPTVVVGFLNGREEPEMFVQDQPNVGSVFSADKISYKVRHIYGFDVLDYRGFYKQTVTG